MENFELENIKKMGGHNRLFIDNEVWFTRSKMGECVEKRFNVSEYELEIHATRASSNWKELRDGEIYDIDVCCSVAAFSPVDESCLETWGSWFASPQCQQHGVSINASKITAYVWHGYNDEPVRCAHRHVRAAFHDDWDVRDREMLKDISQMAVLKFARDIIAGAGFVGAMNDETTVNLIVRTSGGHDHDCKFVSIADLRIGIDGLTDRLTAEARRHQRDAMQTLSQLVDKTEKVPAALVIPRVENYSVRYNHEDIEVAVKAKDNGDIVAHFAPYIRHPGSLFFGSVPMQLLRRGDKVYGLVIMKYRMLDAYNHGDKNDYVCYGDCLTAVAEALGWGTDVDAKYIEEVARVPEPF